MERLQRGTNTLIQAVTSPEMQNNPMLDAMFSTMDRIRSELAPGQEITQVYLDKYLWKVPPFGLETATLEYLPRVTFGERREMSARFGKDLPARFSIRELSGSNIISATPRNDYFPVLYESSRNEAVAVIGMDRGADPIIRLAMEQARDNGEVTTYSFFPLLGAGDQTMVSRHFLPIYKSGGVPATITERRSRLQGFVSVATYYPIADFAAFLPEGYQGMDGAFFQQGNYQNEKRDPELQDILKQGSVLETPYLLPALNNAPWMAVTRAKPELIAAMVSPTRWWVLSIGTLVTIWIGSILLWSRRQSARVIRLVRERTQDLVERTEKLHEVNKELSESEARYRMLADNASDVIYTIDLDGNYHYISPSITKHTGYEAAEFIGYPITWHLTEESADSAKASLEKAKSLIRERPASLKNYIFEHEMNCRNGSVITFESTISSLTDDKGMPIGLLGVSRDITERKRNELEKKMLEEAFRQSQKLEAIGTLAGGVAHDFNNLLAGILGHAQLLKRRLTGMDKAESSLAVIENAALRGKDLTGQLLGFARKGSYQKVSINLNESIAEVVQLIELTVDKRIIIKTELSIQTPGIIGDPGQINQLILNLAVNARDAMTAGGEMLLKTSVQQLDDQFCRHQLGLQEGTYSILRVTDNGVGMTQEKMERIFEPFYTDKQDGSGTGLGLAMVYGVAKNHGGVVKVKSQPGKGTTFTVYFPYAESVAAEKSAVVNNGEPVSGSGYILLVDDEQLVRNVAEDMLGELGYKVLQAKDGMDAIELYSKHQETIDLVIVDMIMPAMNGVDCLRKLKEINPQVKAILATGYSQDSITEKFGPDQIHGFLQKPFGIQELSELVSGTI